MNSFTLANYLIDGKFLLFIFLDEKLFYFLLKEILMEENDMPWVTCFYPLFSINA
jgi:hypothetical protein